LQKIVLAGKFSDRSIFWRDAAGKGFGGKGFWREKVLAGKGYGRKTFWRVCLPDHFIKIPILYFRLSLKMK